MTRWHAIQVSALTNIPHTHTTPTENEVTAPEKEETLGRMINDQRIKWTTRKKPPCCSNQTTRILFHLIFAMQDQATGYTGGSNCLLTAPLVPCPHFKTKTNSSPGWWNQSQVLTYWWSPLFWGLDHTHTSLQISRYLHVLSSSLSHTHLKPQMHNMSNPSSYKNSQQLFISCNDTCYTMVQNAFSRLNMLRVIVTRME